MNTKLIVFCLAVIILLGALPGCYEHLESGNEQITSSTANISYLKVEDVENGMIKFKELNTSKVIAFKYYCAKMNLQTYNNTLMDMEFSCGLQINEDTIRFFCRPPFKDEFVSSINFEKHKNSAGVLRIFCPVSSEQAKLLMTTEGRIMKAEK